MQQNNAGFGIFPNPAIFFKNPLTNEKKYDKTNIYISISNSGKIVEMIGFIVILLGVLVYSEVIICKFKGFDENIKKK